MVEFKYVNTQSQEIADLLIDHSKKPVIHDFSQTVEVTEKPVIDRRIKELPNKPKAINVPPAPIKSEPFTPQPIPDNVSTVNHRRLHADKGDYLSLIHISRAHET